MTLYVLALPEEGSKRLETDILATLIEASGIDESSERLPKQISRQLIRKMEDRKSRKLVEDAIFNFFSDLGALHRRKATISSQRLDRQSSEELVVQTSSHPRTQLSRFIPEDEVPTRQFVIYASTKVSIGHGEAAAGVTSLIKCLLKLQASRLQPYANIKDPVQQVFSIEPEGSGNMQCMRRGGFIQVWIHTESSAAVVVKRERNPDGATHRQIDKFFGNINTSLPLLLTEREALAHINGSFTRLEDVTTVVSETFFDAIQSNSFVREEQRRDAYLDPPKLPYEEEI